MLQFSIHPPHKHTLSRVYRIWAHTCTKLQAYIFYMYLYTPDRHTNTQCPPDPSLAHNYLASLTDRVRAEIDPRHWRLLTLYLPSKHTHTRRGGNSIQGATINMNVLVKLTAPHPFFLFSPPRGNIHAANKGQGWGGGGGLQFIIAFNRYKIRDEVRLYVKV